MSLTVTYTGRRVQITARTEWTLQEEDLVFAGDELKDRWEPDDYDADPMDGVDVVDVDPTDDEF